MDPTFALFLATAVAWLGLEFYFIFSGQATISERIQRLFAFYPPFGMLAGLLVGLLMGHFFWH